jgi:hypothetical protein
MNDIKKQANIKALEQERDDLIKEVEQLKLQLQEKINNGRLSNHLKNLGQNTEEQIKLNQPAINWIKEVKEKVSKININ